MSMHADAPEMTLQGRVDIFKLFWCKVSENPQADKQKENATNLEINNNIQI